MECSEPWEDQRRCCNGVNVKIEKETYNFTNVYNREGVQNVKQLLAGVWEKNLAKKCIVVGDWNARIGNLGSKDELHMDARPTKDEERNNEGYEMLELFDDYGFNILNGNMEGDWGGEVTHVGYRSKSVIDYGAANEEAWENITRFEVGDKTESDHFPLELTLVASYNDKKDVKNEIIWQQTVNKKNCEEYQNKLRQATSKWDEWKDIARAIREVTPKQVWKPQLGKTPWWTAECYEARLRKDTALRNARAGGSFQDYHVARTLFKKFIKARKQDHQKSIVVQLSRMTTIGDAWKFINAHKRKTLLNGQLEKTTSGYEEQRSWEAEEISAVEFYNHLKKLKLKKAAGPDGIKAESILFADEETIRKIHRIFNHCIQGNRIPNEWRDAKIFPLHKKGDPREASNYRGISLVNIVYKLYANVIVERLEKFVEESNILPDCQNGFRKKRSTIDNIIC